MFYTLVIPGMLKLTRKPQFADELSAFLAAYLNDPMFKCSNLDPLIDNYEV